jgi:LCP family protein required for cell wall assembly
MSKSNRKRHRRTSTAGIFGRLISILLLLASAAFAGLLYYSGLVPEKLLLLGGIVLVAFVLIVFIMTRNAESKLRYVVGMLIAFLLIAVLAVSGMYLFKTMQTAKKISAFKEEVTQVGLYVKAGNEDSFDVTNVEYRYGILTALDKENTNSAIAQLRDTYSVPVMTKEYQTLADLVEAVETDKVDVIIMNSAYVDVLEEMDGYSDIRDRIKEVLLLNITTKVADDVRKPYHDGNTFALYISGIDTRTEELISKSRSDVNILAIVNTKSHQILLLSTPRDYFVPLSISDGQRDKLTHAGIYGVSVSMDTLGMLYDIDVDYHFRVNFTGFERIIDALGGVTVYSEKSFQGLDYYFAEGENTLNGAEALAFCRERYAFEDGDNQRGRNQLAVVRAVINKALSVDMLLHYTEVLDAVEGSFETSMPYDTISTIVKNQLESPAKWNIVQYSVTGTGSEAVPYSMSQTAYVMIPDEESVAKAIDLIQQVYAGATIKK